MRGVLLAVAVLVSAPFVRRFGGFDTTTLTWGESRTFAEQLDDDESVERAIFRRELAIAIAIAAVIAARLALV